MNVSPDCCVLRCSVPFLKRDAAPAHPQLPSLRGICRVPAWPLCMSTVAACRPGCSFGIGLHVRTVDAHNNCLFEANVCSGKPCLRYSSAWNGYRMKPLGLP